MSSKWFSAALSVALVGCDDASPAPSGGADPGPCTVQLDDPTALVTFPDRAMLVEDATTVTGLRLRFDPARYPAVAELWGGFLPTLTDDLSEVDGFGVNAEAFFRFGRELDQTLLPVNADGSSAGAGFVVLGESPYLVPALTSTVDGTLFVAPLRPLPPRSEVAAYATRALTGAAGGCLEPSATTAELLARPDAPTSAAVAALVGLGAIRDASELVAITTYPTQSVYEDAEAISADIAGRSFDFIAPPSCEETDDFVRCEAAFVAGDYRDQTDGVIRRAAGAPAAPAATYTMPLTVWLPRERRGPVPTLLFQHGLTSNREYGGSRLARHFAPRGIAVVAIDAVEHGEHPTVTEPREPIDTMQAFFSISFDAIETRAFEAARLRDNIAQSTFDRLQLVRLLQQHPEIDGAPGADLDMGRLAFAGVSAGGIMGPQHIALDGSIGAAVLAVPGARVAMLMNESIAFAPLIVLLRPIQATEADQRRFFPLVQTILDRSDPASWAPAIYGTRPTGVTGRPDVLVGVALDDAVMPNVASYDLGRALGIPMVEPVLRPQPGFERIAGPIADNMVLGNERATAGLLQFDVVDGEGGLVPVDHNNLLESGVGLEAWTHFLTTHFAGAAEIRDPYAALGISRP